MTDLSIKSFEPIKERFLKLSKEPVFIQECSFALQALTKNNQLVKCSPNSLLQAVYNTALLGLSLNPVQNLAYLVPRYNKGQMEAQLMPSYQGLVKLLTDTGTIKKVVAHCVYESDEFEITLGTAENVIHKPKFKSKKIEGAYAIAEFNDRKQIEYMPKSDLDYIKSISESFKAYEAKKITTCVWVDFEPEMSRKTVIKRLVKYLPKSESFDKVYEAVAKDNEDYMLDPISNKATYLFNLINTCTFDEDYRGRLESEIHSGITDQRASEIIGLLKENQLNPITHLGNAGSQKAIHKQLDKHTK